MREKWARRIAYITGMIVLILAAYFSWVQNPRLTLQETESKDQNKSISKKNRAVDIEKIKRGMQVYDQQNCAMCHAIEGRGNPRYPLDGVGEKRSVEELLHWVIGDASIKDQLSAGSYRLKQTHRELPGDELETLIYYLQSLK